MKYIWFIVLFLAAHGGFSQDKAELHFIEHLLNKGNYKEVIFLIDRDSLKFSPVQQDSVNFYKGWAQYSLKELDLSTSSFLKVGKGSPFYSKSQFFAGYNQIYLGRYAEARKIFGEQTFDEGPKQSLANFELSGIDMLEGNWSKAGEQLGRIDRDVAFLNQHVSALQQIGKEKQTHRKKSALLAGVMSGIIPGSGKIYAGKTGEGIASMIATAGFGLVAWENHRKLGIENLKTIFFGGVFLASYASTIYGSVLSVKITEHNYHDALHNQILFQLHIPLRNFFE